MNVEIWKIHELFNKHCKQRVAEFEWSGNTIRVYYCEGCDSFIVNVKFKYLLSDALFLRKIKGKISSKYKKSFAEFCDEIKKW